MRGKPTAEWTVLIKDHHPGYLTWGQHEANLAVLASNAAARGDDRAACPPREGTALLQGLAVCGRCGLRMTIRYHTRHGTRIPDYVCQNDGIRTAQPICQHLTGDIIDSAVGDLILTALTPAAIEVTLAVSDELIAQAERADQLRQAHVQRAEHAADAARHRYLAVDAANRLVADALEADWNTALRALAAARDDYRKATAAATVLNAQQRDKIRALAVGLPALWNDPATPMRERKRLIRLLITDVTLTRGQDTITAAIRFPAGRHHVLRLPVPKNAWQLRATPAPLTELIDHLLDNCTYAQIAGQAERRRPHQQRRTPLGRRPRRQTGELPPDAQPRPAAMRPRPAQPRTGRQRPRRPPQQHQALAPPRPDHRRASRRPRHLPLPPRPDPPGQRRRRKCPQAPRQRSPLRPPQPPPPIRTPPHTKGKCQTPRRY